MSSFPGFWACPHLLYNIDIPPFTVTKLQNVKNAPMRMDACFLYQGCCRPGFRKIGNGNRQHFPFCRFEHVLAKPKTSRRARNRVLQLNVYSKGNVAILIVTWHDVYNFRHRYFLVFAEILRHILPSFLLS